jgi:hypothetical protein
MEAVVTAEPREQVQLWFWTEKVPGEGEDAEPLLLVGYERSLLAVFDGMGGAGGTVYDTPGGSHSGAWFASRLARDVVAGHLPEIVGPGPDIDGAATARLLTERLRAALVKRLDEFDAPRSTLRSKLLKALPTTMAMAYLVRTEPDGDAYACHCFWAGDSRMYLFDPESGAQQLTTDDYRSGGDALRNLIDDAVMNNCLSADTDFHINYRRVDLQVPFLLIAATDGCFGYVPSPMHFEHLILSTLAEAPNPDAWREALRSSVVAVAGDDAALALLGVGGHIDGLRDIFANRLSELRTTYIEPLDEVEREMQRAQQEAGELKERRVTLRAELWEKYKPEYERHLVAQPAPEPAAAPAPSPAAAAAPSPGAAPPAEPQPAEEGGTS